MSSSTHYNLLILFYNNSRRKQLMAILPICVQRASPQLRKIILGAALVALYSPGWCHWLSLPVFVLHCHPLLFPPHSDRPSLLLLLAATPALYSSQSNVIYPPHRPMCRPRIVSPAGPIPPAIPSLDFFLWFLSPTTSHDVCTSYRSSDIACLQNSFLLCPVFFLFTFTGEEASLGFSGLVLGVASLSFYFISFACCIFPGEK